MGLAALLADGDLFEPVVAMETEQEGYDHKKVKLFIHTYSDSTLCVCTCRVSCT